MILERAIDPETGDFADGPSGSFAQATVLENKIIRSFTIALGSWEGDPALGHRFDELARANDSAETRARLADLVRAALQWLLDTGELVTVEVTVESFDAGMLAFEADCTGPAGTISVGPFFVSVGAN